MPTDTDTQAAKAQRFRALHEGPEPLRPRSLRVSVRWVGSVRPVRRHGPTLGRGTDSQPAQVGLAAMCCCTWCTADRIRNATAISMIP